MNVESPATQPLRWFGMYARFAPTTARSTACLWTVTSTHHRPLSIISTMIEAVERPEHSRAPVQRLADRMAGYLVYFAISSAVLTYLMTQNIYWTISVIIVAGACGIAAGTPLAILGDIGRSARLGAIIKGGVHLETLDKVDTVVLDKADTLTFGRPEMQAVVPAHGVTVDEVLDAAAMAELRSEHPLGKVIVRFSNRPRSCCNRPNSGPASLGSAGGTI